MTAITLIGHGIWVLLAFIGRSLFSDSTPTQVRRACSHCGTARGVVNGRCENCGAVPVVSAALTRRDELLATARQLEIFKQRGEISDDLHEQFFALVNRELVRLQQPELAQRAPAAPPIFQPVERPARESQSVSNPPPVAESVTSAEPPILEAEVVENKLWRPQPLPPPLPQPLPPEERARRFVERQQTAAAGESPFAAPLTQPSEAHADPTAPPVLVPASPPRPPTPPARPLADVLQSFMEESNIRWGEVLAGILIVISALGLVISLRAKLQAIPYFPALLFMLFTVAFWGAGMYTLRRWKLKAVSRVILIISLLLVPLSFSAAIVLSGSGAAQRSLLDPLLLVALAIGTVVFGTVTFTASRELVGEAAWRLSAAVLGTSLAQVFINRLATPEMSVGRINLLVTVPLVSFLIAAVGQIYRGRAWRQVSPRRAEQLFLVLGIATFAFLGPVALLVYHAAERWVALSRLSPALSLAAAAVLGLGLLVYRRTLARKLAPVQTAGLALVIFGGALMLAMVALAWPKPELLCAVGIVNAALLVVLAVAGRLPLLHAPAVLCATLAGVVGFHLSLGHLSDPTQLSGLILASMLSGQTSLLLLLLSAVLGAVAWGLKRTDHRPDALYIAGSAGAICLLGALIAVVVGFTPLDIALPHWKELRGSNLAAPLLLVYGIVLASAAIPLRRDEATWAGALLCWLALVYAATFNTAARGILEQASLLPLRPVFAGTLTFSLLAILASALSAGKWLWGDATTHPEKTNSPRWRYFIDPLSKAGATALLLATPFIFWVAHEHFFWHAAYAALALVAWFALAALQREPAAIYLAQSMFALAIGLVTAASVRQQIDGRFWYLDARHVQAQGTLLAIGAFSWSIMRRATRERTTLQSLLVTRWPTFDQLLLATVVRATPLLAIAAAWPGLIQELSPTQALPPAWARQCEIAGGIGAWIMLAAALIALAFSLWERVTLPALAGITISLFAVPWLVATWFEPTQAVASAARWTTALFGIAGASVFVGRAPIFAFFERLPGLNWGKLRKKAYVFACAQPLLFGGGPVLVITLVAVSLSLQGIAAGGPAAESIFARVGPTISYAGPLLIVVGILLAYALRERQAEYVVGGSLVFQLAANLAFLLHASHTPGMTTAVYSAEWLQWNAIAAGAFGLIWHGLRPWLNTRTALEWGQLIVALGFTAGIVLQAIGAVFFWPYRLLPEMATLGGSLSYVTLVLATGLVAWRSIADAEWKWPLQGANLVAIALWALVPIIATTVGSHDTANNWWAYHLLAGGWLLVATLVVTAIGAARMTPKLETFAPSHWLAAAFCLLVAIFAICGNSGDPHGPFWSVGMTSGVWLLLVALGVARRSQSYGYAATTAAVTTVSLYWFAPAAFSGITGPPLDAWCATLLEAIVAATALTAGIWLALEIRSQMRTDRPLDEWFRGPRVHCSVSLVGLALMSLVVFYFLIFLTNDHWRQWLPLVAHFDVVALAATINLTALLSLLIAALWDRRAMYLLPTLYTWGLLALTFAVAVFDVPNLQWYVALLLAVAGYVALTGHVWSYGANLAAGAARLGISDPVGGLTRVARWLPIVSILLTAIVSLIPLAVVLNDRQLAMRVAAAFSPALAAWGLICLAQERRRDALQLTGLLLAGLTGVYLGWAQIEPAWTGAVWLTRVFRLLMVLAAATFLYGLVLPRFVLTTGTWHASTRKAGFIWAVAAMVTFVVVLTLELALFKPGIGAPVDGMQVAAVAVVLLALIAGLISLAVLPGRDPLTLSERGRMAYVYAAQATGVLLFVHLYVCRPLWFDGVLRPYWPFILLGIAFASVGLSELFHRTKIKVLAEPFQQTGLFLPLLPALGWWIAGSQADYSLLLLCIGLLYVVLSVTRKSWAAMVGAVLAGNGALWALLSKQHFDFTEHPQFWLIPPAVSVLVAAQLNRQRLEAGMLTSIRYVCMILIYLSSTSEIFLRGGESLWPPMILAALSIAGALLGIVLRIRAFLYLGTGFVLMAMISMVWHAARAIEHVWPWWAFGIGSGIAILILFGIFEKKRAEVMQWIDRLRQWEQ